MVKVVILSENSQSVAQLVTTVISFSAWDKSRFKWDNSQNSTQKMRTFAIKRKIIPKRGAWVGVLFKDFSFYAFVTRIRPTNKYFVPIICCEKKVVNLEKKVMRAQGKGLPLQIQKNRVTKCFLKKILLSNFDLWRTKKPLWGYNYI